MKPVGICNSLLMRERTGDGGPTFEDYMEKAGIPYEYIDCYDYDIIEKLDNYSALIWHYENFVNADLMEAQNILDIAEAKGLKVHPNHSTGWHFDDKIAETYAFQSIGAPIPKTWMFYELDKCLAWLHSEARYPLVAKLRRGSGANNVKLLKTEGEARKYAKKMFSSGMSPAPSLLYKTYSKVQSTRDWKTLVSRTKRIPDFLRARRFGRGMPVEKGYCYFQEFIENDGYDIKVAVVGDRCSFLVRSTRKGSFKASGGGTIVYDKALMNKNIVDSAFKTADELGLQRVGFDYVVDTRTGQGLIVEMCFGFDSQAIYDCGGYWDRSFVWHDEPLNVPAEVVKNIMK